MSRNGVAGRRQALLPPMGVGGKLAEMANAGAKRCQAGGGLPLHAVNHVKYQENADS